MLRYVAGDATPAERARVEAWAASAPRNRVRLDETAAAWEASAPRPRETVTGQEKEEDWTAILARAHQSDRRPRPDRALPLASPRL